MGIQENDTIRIHQEFIRRETSIHLALKQSGLANPPIIKRFLPAIGEVMCRIGTRLQEQSYHKLSSEEASAPTFLIML